jgi:tetratricopeptide (TPR) repeat protein
MSRLRHLNSSLASVAIVAMFASVVVAAGVQEQSVQKLLERGALDEAVQRAAAEGGNPEATFLAAQALMKMDNGGAANERYAQLRDQGDESWKAIGESGVKLLARDVDGAMEAATRAVSANAGNPFAHHQLGIAATRQNNWERALEAFTKTIELKGDFAYAHYYAGQAAQRLRQTPKAAHHFTAFLKLAPEAPERQAVQSILRILR